MGRSSENYPLYDTTTYRFLIVTRLVWQYLCDWLFFQPLAEKHTKELEKSLQNFTTKGQVLKLDVKASYTTLLLHVSLVQDNTSKLQ